MASMVGNSQRTAVPPQYRLKVFLMAARALRKAIDVNAQTRGER